MPQPSQAWVWLARIRRSQGRKGEVFAELLTDFPQKFSERQQLWLLPADASPRGTSGPDLGTRELPIPQPNARSAQLTAHWPHKGGVVLHFAGVDSISAAEALKGMIVAIPRVERADLAEDEAYISDLTGCTLVDVGGAEPICVGTIEDVDRSMGPAPLLAVRGPQGEILIPFAKSYLRRIDLATKRVEMALPEGLANLNSLKKK